MGKGIDLARGSSPEHAALIDDLKDQLLIVFLNRLGGNVEIPVHEIDGTGQFMLSLSLDYKDKKVTFKTSKKS